MDNLDNQAAWMVEQFLKIHRLARDGQLEHLAGSLEELDEALEEYQHDVLTVVGQENIQEYPEDEQFYDVRTAFFDYS